ncbi:zinc finger CCCH domain-containing protein 3 [Tachysurus ichikawai]
MCLSVHSPASQRRPSVGVETVRSRYSLRRGTQAHVKSLSGVRRGQSRVLRLSPSSFSTAPWSSRTGTFTNVHIKDAYQQQEVASCQAGT